MSLLTPKARGTGGGGTQTILTTDGRNAQAVAALLEVKPRAAARGNVGIEGSASDPIDDVQLQLLLGKVYSEWKGHRCDESGAVECAEQGVGGSTCQTARSEHTLTKAHRDSEHHQTPRLSGRRSGQRARKRPAGVLGTAWHFTGCRSRGSPTHYSL